MDSKQIETPHRLFRHLITSLDLRPDARGRDAALYDRLKMDLGMRMEKPAVFFARRSDVTLQVVLDTFLHALQPFVAMVEQIYSALALVGKSGSGGKDFSIRYNFEQSSLAFDLEAFRRFQKCYDEIRVRGWLVKYNSDAVPGFRYGPEQLGNPGWPEPSKTRVPIDSAHLTTALTTLREIAIAHVRTLEMLVSRWEIERFEITAENLVRYGVAYDNQLEYVRTIDRLREWLSSAQWAVDHIPQIDVYTVMQRLDPSHAEQKLRQLEWLIKSLGEKRDETRIVESVLEFLELPYWKKRWQVFEIWVFTLCLRALADKRPVLFDNRGPVVMKTGQSSNPAAAVRVDEMTFLELWLEYPLSGSLRPDIALVRQHQGRRKPVRVIECKQRESESDKTLIGDAQKYAEAMAAGSTNLLVNYDKFTGPSLYNGYSHSHADVETVFLESVQPNTEGALRVSALVAELVPVSRTEMIFIVDTTGSMHSHLSEVWNVIESLAKRVSDESQPVYRGILFGDHGSDEPYVTQSFQSITGIADLVNAMRSAPLSSGGDVPEALEDALHCVNADSGTEGAIRMVAVFTDAPAHTPSDCPFGFDFSAEVYSLIANSYVIVVNCGKQTWDQLGWCAFENHGSCVLTSLPSAARDERVLSLVKRVSPLFATSHGSKV